MEQSQYFKLPEKSGKYPHPDLHIALSRQYQGKDWNTTKSTLEQNHQLCLPVYLFREALIHLRSKERIYNECGKRIPKTTITQTLNDIYEQRSPYRAEWLNSQFTHKNNNWYIKHLVFDNEGQPKEVIEQLDPDTLMEDRAPGISLEDWLKRATPQGLPSTKTKNGSLCYWYSRDGAVAGFGADAGGVLLVCVGDPQGSDGGLGVRPFVLAEGKSKISAKRSSLTESTLDERITQALDAGKPFTYGELVYVPTQDVMIKR
ncbi:MAG: hypothetical protein AABY15_09195 [Nanoarchaeota archaeon]